MAIDELRVNGDLTLGENIADLGGLLVAYDALQRSLVGRLRVLIDGMSPEQRFFMAYANNDRNKTRPALARAPTRCRILTPQIDGA